MDKDAQRVDSKKKLREIQRFLRDWDPIGVFEDKDDPGPPDEYDGYAPLFLSALSRGESVDGLIRLLGSVQVEAMGLRETPDRNRQLAVRLFEWWHFKAPQDP